MAISDSDRAAGEASGIRTRDILWTLGMCAISVSLSPIVAFYMLLVD
jgi:hypothetical protein